MIDAIANPITFYYGGSNVVINQAGHSKDLYNYYWTSYSRGTDGAGTIGDNNFPLWHNDYLDGYIPLRVKSIYDPCPYSYRIPSNGTYNQFTLNPGWTTFSYLGGVSWNLNTLGESWFTALGWRANASNTFMETCRYGFYYSSVVASQSVGYAFAFNSGKGIFTNRTDWLLTSGMSVRCIEIAKLLSMQIRNY